jgi:HSP20 family molecular chaperone IbpA
VDTEKAHPYYENGVLTVTLPKAEAKKAKKLSVATDKALEGK